MDIIKKINKLLGEEGIVTGDVETNTTKGNIDLVGGKCKEGYRYCTKRKVCVPITNEAAPMKGLSQVNILNSHMNQKNPVYIGTKKDAKRVEKILKEYFKFEKSYAEVIDLPFTGSEQKYIQDVLDGKKEYGE